MEITKQELLLIEKARKFRGEKSLSLIGSIGRIIIVAIIIVIVAMVASSFFSPEELQRYGIYFLSMLVAVLGEIAMARERQFLLLIKKLIKNLEEVK